MKIAGQYAKVLVNTIVYWTHLQPLWLNRSGRQRLRANWRCITAGDEYECVAALL
jgi:hypothetical protein